jgi:hypothetical protein
MFICSASAVPQASSRMAGVQSAAVPPRVLHDSTSTRRSAQPQRAHERPTSSATESANSKRLCTFTDVPAVRTCRSQPYPPALPNPPLSRPQPSSSASRPQPSQCVRNQYIARCHVYPVLVCATRNLLLRGSGLGLEDALDDGSLLDEESAGDALLDAAGADRAAVRARNRLLALREGGVCV